MRGKAGQQDVISYGAEIGTRFGSLFFLRIFEAMSCRTGPLRVGRPLRGAYTFLATTNYRGPPVGRKRMIPTNGRTDADDPAQTGTHTTKWPSAVGPSGRTEASK